MSYPERGAGYRHTPKFIDRMKDAETSRDAADMNGRFLDKASDMGVEPSGFGSAPISPANEYTPDKSESGKWNRQL